MSLRDAAHEAHHALDAKVKRGRWDRETIHRAVMKMGKSRAVASEIMARAVEQIVCADLGVDCGTIENWAFISCIEAMKAGVSMPSSEWFASQVRAAMATPKARKAADAVLALGAE